MTTQEIYDLPADAEEAFPIFESRLRDKYLDDSFGNITIANQRDYAIELIAFCGAYEVDIGHDLDGLMSWDNDEFYPAFNALEAKARIMAVRFSLQANRKAKSGLTPTYVLDSSQKKHIHDQINEIREIIAGADLTDQKRDALVKRLNAFAEEVDRDRTKGEALMAFYVASKREVKEVADLSDHIEKIFRMLSKGKELFDALPAPTVPKQIEGPQAAKKQGGSGELDDEIPF